MESKSVWVVFFILAVSLLLEQIISLGHTARIKKLEKELETVTAMVAEIDAGCNKLPVYPKALNFTEEMNREMGLR